MENKRGIKHAKIITPSEIVEDGYIHFQSGVITDVGEMTNLKYEDEISYLNAEGLILSPGWIDPHTHGGNGFDYMDCSHQDVIKILSWIASTGVTGVLPTIASSSFDEYISMIKKLVSVINSRPKGASILGLHLEGPFLNKEMRGAQPASSIRYPSISEMEKFIDLAENHIRLVTLAPEIPGALELIKYLKRKGIVVSCGHSKATFDQFNAAFDIGLNRLTHTFNGMPPLHHREPGILGAALTNPDIYCELIMDGIHVNPIVGNLLLQCKSDEKVILITDATQAAGLEDGVYIRPGNRKIIVKNGEARLESGSLAGSTLTMQQAVKNVVHLMGQTPQTAIRMASSTSAMSLGLADKKGSLDIGKDADLLVLNDDLSVLLTFVKGNLISKNPDLIHGKFSESDLHLFG